MGGQLARAIGIATLLTCAAAAPPVVAYGWWQDRGESTWCFDLVAGAVEDTTEPELLDEANAAITDPDGYDAAVEELEAQQDGHLALMDWCTGATPGEPVHLGD